MIHYVTVTKKHSNLIGKENIVHRKFFKSSRVALRVIRAADRLVNTQQVAHFRECSRLEITALIAMNAVRRTRSADPVPYKHLCRGCGTLVGHCKHLSSVSKTALNC